MSLCVFTASAADGTPALRENAHGVHICDAPTTGDTHFCTPHREAKRAEAIARLESAAAELRRAVSALEDSYGEKDSTTRGVASMAAHVTGVIAAERDAAPIAG